MTATNAYGVEVTDELKAEGDAIYAALVELSSRYDGWLDAMGAELGDGHGAYVLEGALEDISADIARFTDTNGE